MKANEIRSRFLGYFQKRGHEIVPSSSLVPAGDQTLLFANAGMNQFKDVFTGKTARAVKRATSSQKCVRAGGKHNDLENVGVTARHHTFFEMLGNFSFGDYFKEGAIGFAWELLTVELGLDKGRLWITVHDSDDEAGVLWRKISGVPAERIVRMGDKDNFWAMGSIGPCGPCSEIIYDQGPGTGCGKPGCDIRCGCDRFLEIWNLVFMQFEQKGDGSRSPLPRPSIDTGMGLERLCAVMAGKPSNYDTDLFTPLLAKVAELSGVAYDAGEGGKGHRVLADHAKAAAFLVCDGVIPSNEGRGYVLRRIMRRAVRHAYMMGAREPLLCRLLESVFGIYRESHPGLLGEAERIRKTVEREETNFLATLAQGIQLFEKGLPGWKAAGRLPGEEAFALYDTYGFPLDMTELMASENGLAVDGAAFEKSMAAQRDKARQASMFKASQLEGLHWKVLSGSAQEFCGYTDLQCESPILRIAVTAEGRLVIAPARCAFYAESGGQTGDSGTVEISGNTFRVLDTQMSDGLRVLVLDAEEGSLPPGADTVLQKVDAEPRRRTAIHHTCTHLLHKALREVLGKDSEQRGSWVGPSRLRFDFPHPEAVAKDKLAEIEEKVNAAIQQDLPLTTRETALKDAMGEGVTALFGEKYGDRVRIVDIQGYSKELCGGTHLRRTGEAMAFAIESESAIASGVRRIEAIAGPVALAELLKQRSILRSVCQAVQVRPEELESRVRELRESGGDMAKDLERLRVRLAMAEVEDSVRNPETAGGSPLVARVLDGLDAKVLRKAAEDIRAKSPGLSICFGSTFEGKVSIVLALPRTLCREKGMNAGRIMKELAALVGGGGGGSPDFAQAGGSDPSGLPKVMESFKNILKGMP